MECDKWIEKSENKENDNKWPNDWNKWKVNRILDLWFLIADFRMSEWVNEWMSEWLNDWMSEWVNEWMSEWVNDWMIEWLNDWMSEWVNEWMIEWMNDWNKWKVINNNY